MRLVGRRRRAMGLALVGYGVAGALLLAAAALSVGPSVETIEALARSSADVRATLAATRDAFDGFGTSLVEGRQSAERAASSARSSAAAAGQLAQAMSLSIFGQQPFRTIAAGFAQQSADLETLARELDDLGTALGRNEADVRDLRDHIGALHARTSVLASSPVVAGVDRIAPLAYALLGWLALQALAALWLGIVLWREAAA